MRPTGGAPRPSWLLASGNLGQHNGLPASIIVTTTLAELEAAAGRGLTGGGSILPMSDVIRLARHYLAIFDKGQALALYHTKRLASPAQRIVLYARECEGYAPLGNRQVSGPISPSSAAASSSSAQIGRTKVLTRWQVQGLAVDAFALILRVGLAPGATVVGTLC
jgi:Domain of unknown function (DUF222)